MKTVCKKLLCLMLVAMMLVSAVPFAFATEGNTCTHENAVLYAGSNGVSSDSAKLATCTETGNDVYHCTDCNTYYGVTVPEKGHDYDAGVVTTAATCSAAGVKTYTCKNDATHTRTETIPATGNHNFVNGYCTQDGCTAPCTHSYSGSTCTVCGDVRNAFKVITFHYMDSDCNWVSETRYTYASGEHVSLPTVPNNPNSGFSYWKQNPNDTGMKIAKDETLVVNSETPENFYAIYNAKSSMSELKIYAVRYVNGVRKEANYLYSKYFTTGNTNNMYQYLWDHDDEIVTAAINELGGSGYTWNSKFYDYFTDEELTDADMKDNGNKSVYIKMNTKDENEAKVLLYVHKSKSSVVADILEMNGYNAGEKVYLNTVKNFLDDEGYSWSSISSLYTDEEWDDLLDGESPSGTNVYVVDDNGTHVIHVILSGYSNSKADTSNPKTGDNIMIAVSTMALAAAALVTMVELKKRKMI